MLELYIFNGQRMYKVGTNGCFGKLKTKNMMPLPHADVAVANKVGKSRFK